MWHRMADVKYVLLLYVTLALTLLAFVTSVHFLHQHPAYAEHRSLEYFVWVLGCFSVVVTVLAGALSVWMGKVSKERAGQERVQRLLDAMNHLEDGVVALDERGGMTGCNLKARELIERPLRSGMTIEDAFQFLNPDELAQISGPGDSREVVTQLDHKGKVTHLRFRKHTTRHVGILMISDVTRAKDQAARDEHASQLELIGRIAQGVAHDFNNILCAISGHASLLDIADAVSEPHRESVRTIALESDRGAALARQLVDLCEPTEERQIQGNIRMAVIGAAAMLGKVAQAEGWQIVTDHGCPDALTSMPRNPLEQMLIRFGLQVIDQYDEPGTLHVQIVEPGSHALFPKMERCSAWAFLGAAQDEKRPVLECDWKEDDGPMLFHDGGGVVQSVVLSVLERFGGRLDVLICNDREHGYRIALPEPEEIDETERESGTQPGSSRRWHTFRVLVAQAANQQAVDPHALRYILQGEMHTSNNVVAAHQRLEQDGPYDVVILEISLLGHDPQAALHKLTRLAPSASFVVVGPSDSDQSIDARDAVYLTTPLQIHSLHNVLLSIETGSWEEWAHGERHEN